MGSYTLGNPIRLTATPVDSAGAAVTSATVAVYVERPDGTIDGPFTPTHTIQTPPLLSFYYYDYAPLHWQGYKYRFVGTTPDWAEEAAFFVEPSDFVT